MGFVLQVLFNLLFCESVLLKLREKDINCCYSYNFIYFSWWHIDRDCNWQNSPKSKSIFIGLRPERLNQFGIHPLRQKYIIACEFLNHLKQLNPIPHSKHDTIIETSQSPHDGIVNIILHSIDKRNNLNIVDIFIDGHQFFFYQTIENIYVIFLLVILCISISQQQEYDLIALHLDICQHTNAESESIGIVCKAFFCI